VWPDACRPSASLYGRVITGLKVVAHALDYGWFHASAKVGHHGLGATHIA